MGEGKLSFSTDYMMIAGYLWEQLAVKPESSVRDLTEKKKKKIGFFDCSSIMKSQPDWRKNAGKFIYI